MITGTNPALLALQQSAKVPHFDGHDRHCEDFVRDWSRYSAYSLLNAPDGPVGDVLKRDLLINCLVGTLKKQYDAAVLRKPGTTFADVWGHLEKRYQVDDPHRWRKEWQQVKLTTTGRYGDVVTLKDLHLFESSFETAKAMVSDWTAQEEIDLILRQLPKKWQLKVLEQEARESQSKHVLKLTNVPQGCNLGQVLQQLGMAPVGVQQMAGCWQVSFRTAAEKEALQNLNLKLDNAKINCMSVRHRWSGADIFKFLSDKIRIEQESWVLTRGIMSEERQPRDSSKGKGKGVHALQGKGQSQAADRQSDGSQSQQGKPNDKPSHGGKSKGKSKGGKAASQTPNGDHHGRGRSREQSQTRSNSQHGKGKGSPMGGVLPWQPAALDRSK